MKSSKIMIGGLSTLSLMSLGVIDLYADETPKPTGNVMLEVRMGFHGNFMKMDIYYLSLLLGRIL